MKIIVADWANFSQVLPIAKKYKVGLEFQELTQPENLDNPDHLIQDMTAQSKDLVQLSIHGPFAELVPASQDPWVRQVAARRFQQVYEIAQNMRADHLILHSGFYPKTYSQKNWIQNAYNFWCEFLKDKTRPGFLHLENVYEDDCTAIMTLVDRVNQTLQDDVLTICLDIGHVSANSSKSHTDWITSLGDRIRYVHLHNNAGILDDHWRLDKGKIDIRNVLDLLQKHSPQATWCVETMLTEIEPSFEWLNRQGYL